MPKDKSIKIKTGTWKMYDEDVFLWRERPHAEISSGVVEFQRFDDDDSEWDLARDDTSVMLSRDGEISVDGDVHLLTLLRILRRAKAWFDNDFEPPPEPKPKKKPAAKKSTSKRRSQ